MAGSESSTDARTRNGRVDRSSLGKVRLINAVFYAHHGVMQEEHELGGRYEVDVEMDLDFDRAAESDGLDGTVDYEEVYNLVQDTVTSNRFYLIEKLSYLIAHRILDRFPIVESVEVATRKPNPPVGGTCDRAEAVYGCDRSSLDR